MTVEAAIEEGEALLVVEDDRAGVDVAAARRRATLAGVLRYGGAGRAGGRPGRHGPGVPRAGSVFPPDAGCPSEPDDDREEIPTPIFR